ncbi:MAG: phage head-tail connector protein, partial [Anaplasmataceae bacterium]|nr:phage head-tail connector protein [Anaplasmataceae bacterium]
MIHNNIEYSRVNPVSADIVKLDDIKSFLRIGNNLEDDFLKKIIVLAIEYIEWYLNISIATQEWKATVHERLFIIDLKYPPIKGITQVTYEEYPDPDKWKVYDEENYKLQGNKLFILDNL